MEILAIILPLALNFTGYSRSVKHDLNGIPIKANKISIVNSMTAEQNYNQVLGYWFRTVMD